MALERKQLDKANTEVRVKSAAFAQNGNDVSLIVADLQLWMARLQVAALKAGCRDAADGFDYVNQRIGAMAEAVIQKRARI